jgi:hypothetical protein
VELRIHARQSSFDEMWLRSLFAEQCGLRVSCPPIAATLAGPVRWPLLGANQRRPCGRHRAKRTAAFVWQASAPGRLLCHGRTRRGVRDRATASAHEGKSAAPATALLLSSFRAPRPDSPNQRGAVARRSRRRTSPFRFAAGLCLQRIASAAECLLGCALAAVLQAANVITVLLGAADPAATAARSG